VLVHVRYDEIALKGGKRSWYERRLRRNLAQQAGLARRQIERFEGRIALHLREGDDPVRVLDGVRRTFGATSGAIVHVVPRTEPEAEQARIFELAIAVAREAVQGGARTFKVVCRRADKRYPIGSMPFAALVGMHVLEAVPELKVDIHTPDLELPVELRPEGLYVATKGVQGPGGYPVGASGRALTLLSGGIDSPVAAWYALKRGLHVDGVYFHAPPFTGEQAKEKVLTLGRAIGRWCPSPMRVFVVGVTAIQEAIKRGLGPIAELRIVLLRRSMYRLARALAKARGFAALVTGEALGQVASQTPENLLAVEAVVPDMLVLRPLIGFDKREIVDLARRIGTFETSILPFQDCCSLFAPRRPATHASVERCLEAEALIPQLADLEAAALRAAEVHRGVQGAPFMRLQEAWDSMDNVIEEFGEEDEEAKDDDEPTGDEAPTPVVGVGPTGGPG
jgi:thiamine biosynthesis protein ThiI